MAEALRIAARGLAAALALGAACALAAAPGGEPPAVDSRYFGVHIHRADSTTPWPFVGFGSWRLWDAGVDWGKLEPAPGAWRFDKLDRLMALAADHQVEPLLTLGVTPAWASARPQEPFVYGPGGAAPPRDLADWENYVATVVGRYQGRLRYLEVWNEPKYGDLEPTKGAFFSGTVSDLVKLACAARRAAQAVDPAVRIVGPGFTGAGDRLERFLAAGGAACIDVVAFHFYAPTPEKSLERIRAVRQIMVRQGVAHLPLWNTEQGYEIVGPQAPIPGHLGFEVPDPETAAAYLPRALALAAAEGVGRFHFYSWERALDQAGAPGVMAQALATTLRWLREARVGPCREAAAVWSCPVARAGRRAWLVWSARGEQHWLPPAAWAVTALEPLAGAGRPLGDAALRVGPAPVLLKQEEAAWLSAGK